MPWRMPVSLYCVFQKSWGRVREDLILEHAMVPLLTHFYTLYRSGEIHPFSRPFAIIFARDDSSKYFFRENLLCINQKLSQERQILKYSFSIEILTSSSNSFISINYILLYSVYLLGSKYKHTLQPYLMCLFSLFLVMVMKNPLFNRKPNERVPILSPLIFAVSLHSPVHGIYNKKYKKNILEAPC